MTTSTSTSPSPRPSTSTSTSDATHQPDAVARVRGALDALITDARAPSRPPAATT